MNINKGNIYSAFLAASLVLPAAHAAEFEILDRFSVDGYTVLKGSADIPGGSFTVGGSALAVKDGKVGIGTAVPSSIFEVNNAVTFDSVDTFPQFMVKDAAGPTGRQLGIGIDTGNFAFIQALNRGSDVMPLSLQRYGGNVGIGTTAPTYKLNIYGAGTVRAGVQSSDTSSIASIVYINNTMNYEAGIFADNAYGINYGASRAVSVISNGNVGIGTTNPVVNLDVNGGIKVGTVTASCTSDIAGTLRWYDGHMSVCNGSNWRQLDNQPPPTIASITPASGIISGGTPITITGTGFNQGPEVFIDGVTATAVTVVSAAQITAITPARAAGTKDVKITNPDGQYCTGAFTYNPLPSITTVSPASGLQGTVITITGTGFASGAGVMVGGTAATVNTVSATQITAVTPASSLSGAKNVTVTNQDTGSVVKTDGFTYLIYATGGAESVSGGYHVHTFTTGGTFTVNTGGNFDVLIVGGGGGGGSDVGGGGGGGQVRYVGNLQITASQTIVVGNGGNGGHLPESGGISFGITGGSSSFGSYSALGGCGAGGRGATQGARTDGWSGGGGGHNSTNSSGNGGGAGGAGNGSMAGGGGGGSAPADGESGNGSPGHGGAGGAGRLETSGMFSNNTSYYGGGGGGSAYPTTTIGTGGTGGGGSGSYSSANGGAGAANTGGGGGGAGSSADNYGGAGGSGIVIIRYPN